MNDMVSVIVSSYNRPPSIVMRAVNSALKQTYPNIEIIVVDDSTSSYPLRNEVERAIRSVSDQVSYIKHQKNEGACAARNTGLQNSKGYFVAFLDDEWLPQKIEKQLEGFSNDNIALVFCGYQAIDDNTNKLIYKRLRYYIKGYLFLVSRYFS